MVYGMRAGCATGSWGPGPEGRDAQGTKQGDVKGTCMKKETSRQGLGMSLLSLPLIDMVYGEVHSSNPKSGGPEVVFEQGLFLESYQRSQTIKSYSIMKLVLDLVDPKVGGWNRPVIRGGIVTVGKRAWHVAPIPSPGTGFAFFGGSAAGGPCMRAQMDCGLFKRPSRRLGASMSLYLLTLGQRWYLILVSSKPLRASRRRKAAHLISLRGGRCRSMGRNLQSTVGIWLSLYYLGPVSDWRIPRGLQSCTRQ